MDNLKINHLAVWAAIILQFVIGFLWYGPIFGDAWMKMEGLTLAAVEAQGFDVGAWLTNIIASVAGIYLLAWLFVKLGVDNMIKGLCYGFLIGFVFVLLANKTTGAFAQDPYALAWITGGFTTVGLALGGLILGAWTKSE